MGNYAPLQNYFKDGLSKIKDVNVKFSCNCSCDEIHSVHIFDFGQPVLKNRFVKVHSSPYQGTLTEVFSIKPGL